MKNPAIERLLELLTYKRRHGSGSESAAIANIVMPAVAKADAHWVDSFGNIYAKVGESKNLFVAHCDTVHRDDGMQEILVDKELGIVYKPQGCGAPLGADDGAGICILLEMLEHGVPGQYLLTRGEECGGLGSMHIVNNDPDFLRQFDRAVAFDRRGCTDVITHQFGGRCCSDEFAQALADQLNLESGLAYEPCPDGVFTDTANFTHLISECTNVACGYTAEHTEGEYLDLEAWMKLRDAVLNVDWESLPTVRSPEIKDRWGFDQPTYGDDLKYMTRKELRAWVKSTPANEVADAIEDLLIELDASLDAAEACSTQDPDFNYEENYYERQI